MTSRNKDDAHDLDKDDVYDLDMDSINKVEVTSREEKTRFSQRREARHTLQGDLFWFSNHGVIIPCDRMANKDDV